MKRIVTVLIVLALAVSLVACTSTTKTSPSSSAPTGFKVAMATDVGGVNDQSFNQSAWEGLQLFKTETGASVSYLESKQETDYGPNLDKLADQGNDIIWGIGFAMGDAVKTAAGKYPDKTYAIVDYAYGADAPKNLIGVVFKAQEPSFLVGYIAAKTTKTNKVGFVGGIKGDVIDQFEYGFRSGVEYAAKELKKTITIDVQYADSFTDQAKGKAIAKTMYTNGCDVVFHAAGGVGIGVIDAAKEAKKWVIGVDRDQSSLAPSNVLTSAMKLVGKAMDIVSTKLKNSEKLAGTTQVFGIKEACAGLPSSNPNVATDVLTSVKTVQADITSGKIAVPFNKTTFDVYIATLK